MKQSDTPFYYTHKRAIISVVSVLLIYVIVVGLVRARTADLVALVASRVEAQQELLITAADLITKNQVDATTQSLIRDCVVDERVEFDNLLGRLNSNLSKSELTRLDRLFGRCGAYFAERDALMVAKLEREVLVYEEYTSLLSAITKRADAADKVRIWQDLLKYEQTRSTLFLELVALQDSIIQNLLLGKEADSPEIGTVLERVRTVQSELIVARDESRTILGTILNQ